MKPGSLIENRSERFVSRETFPSVSRSPTVLFDGFELYNILSCLSGGRTRTRTLDPLIKSQFCTRRRPTPPPAMQCVTPYISLIFLSPVDSTLATDCHERPPNTLPPGPHGVRKIR